MLDVWFLKRQPVVDKPSAELCFISFSFFLPLGSLGLLDLAQSYFQKKLYKSTRLCAEYCWWIILNSNYLLTCKISGNLLCHPTFLKICAISNALSLCCAPLEIHYHSTVLKDSLYPTHYLSVARLARVQGDHTALQALISLLPLAWSKCNFVSQTHGLIPFLLFCWKTSNKATSPKQPASF